MNSMSSYGLRDFVRDLAGLGGIGLLGYGSWLHYPPLGFIVPGVVLVLGLALGGKR